MPESYFYSVFNNKDLLHLSRKKNIHSLIYTYTLNYFFRFQQKMAPKSIQLCIVILMWTHCAQAQISAPTYSNNFLSIGVGARALAMGGSQAAIANDVTAAYWNPAGLMGIKQKYDVSLMHAEYFAGIAKYDYAGVATRIDSQSVIALSVIRFGVDDIPNTQFLFNNSTGALNYSNVSSFSVSNYAFLLSYAHKATAIPGLDLGVSFKVISNTAGSFANSWGAGIDAGVQYHVKKWKLGLMARDITGTYNAWTYNTEQLSSTYAATGNVIPENSIELTLPSIILGAAYSFKINKKIGLLTSVDFVNTFDGRRNTVVSTKVISISPCAGLEIDYLKIVYLRAGIGNIQQMSNFNNQNYTSVQPNFGIGLKIYKFNIDYALTNIGSASNQLYSNIFSLKIALN